MRSRFRRGYTLVEITVVAAIFVLIAVVILANYRGGNRNQRLKLVTEEVLANIRLTQSLAYANAPQDICDADGSVCGSGSLCDPAYPAGCSKKYVWQYGMKFGVDDDRVKYAIGADYNADGQYQSGEIIPNGTVTLPADLVIDSYWAIPDYDIIFAYNSTYFSAFGPKKGDGIEEITIRDTVTGWRCVATYISWADTYETRLVEP